MSEQAVLAFMPQPKRWHKAVSWLLWLANSDAPNWGQHRFAFYSLKDELLTKYGVDDGADWQRITKDCWDCHGTGLYTHYSGQRDVCYRCYGSGVYDSYYVKLHRLRFGGRVFHRPGESQGSKPETSGKMFEGRIRHKRKGFRAVIAFVVLLMMFDREGFWRLFKLLAAERRRRVFSKFARWFPVRCASCKCMLIRKDAKSILIDYGGETGVLCDRCCGSDEAPF